MVGISEAWQSLSQIKHISLSLLEEVVVQLAHGGAAATLAGARLALTKSGTSTIEAALAGVPMVVVYKVSRLTHALLKPLVKEMIRIGASQRGHSSGSTS